LIWLSLCIFHTKLGLIANSESAEEGKDISLIFSAGSILIRFSIVSSSMILSCSNAKSFPVVGGSEDDDVL
jgi:hypothetical protein